MQLLARKIRQAAKDSAMSTRNVKRGRVVRVEPLKVELLADDRVLDDDDLDLSKWVEFYDREFGIDKGDTVILMREHGDWTVIDVVGDTDLDKKKLADV